MTWVLPSSCRLSFSSVTRSNTIPVFVVLVFPGLVMELVPSADLVTH